MNNDDSQLPPSRNPILESYLAFRNGTPFVTRFLLGSQMICFFLSFFLDTHKLAANIPYFTLYNGQIWRIFLSPLLCDRLFSLVISFLSFVEPGRRLERSIGSTPFLCLVITLATLTNAAYIIILFLLCELTGKDSFMYQQTSGIWLVVFGIITIECNRAPPQSTRRLFFFPIRVEFYPFALFVFFSFLTATFEWSHIISIVIGHTYEYGHLECIKPSGQRCKRCEVMYLNGLSNRDGWVKLDQIIGSGAWTTDSNDLSIRQGSGGAGLFSHVQRQFQGLSINSSSTESSSKSTASGNGAATTSSFPSTGGHILGGASRRAAQSAVDPRKARLQAIERRMKAASEEVDIV